MYKKDDIILCESYRWLADYIYGAGFTRTDIIPPKDVKVVCVSLDEVTDFFNLIRGTDKKYILISPRSDYGLFYQKDEPAQNDLVKWLKLNLWGKNIGYEGAYLHPRCDTSQCSVKDRYCIKMYAWTKCTFNEIPDNVVKWFVANNGIYDDDRVVSIPFGVSGDKPEHQERWADLDWSKPRDKLLYVNFALHTAERAELMQYYFNLHNPNITVDIKPIPFDDFKEKLLTHQFVLCPDGNGVDCYRTWECVYAGVIPVVNDNFVTQQYHKYPIMCLDNLRDWHTLYLCGMKQQVSPQCTLSYWRNQIHTLRKEL